MAGDLGTIYIDMNDIHLEQTDMCENNCSAACKTVILLHVKYL